jgi:hypothetical protein
MNAAVHKGLKWGLLFVEVLALLVLYNGVLLDPFPFDFLKVTLVVTFFAISGLCAYFSSSQFREPSHVATMPLRELATKPPLGLWWAAIILLIGIFLWAGL